MQEFSNENSQYKYEEMTRPDGFGGKGMSFGGGWKRPRPWWWQAQRPWWGGPFFPGGGFGQGFGWPWFLFALRSMVPRDAARLIEELDKMEY